MGTDRYIGASRFNPGGLAAAIGINAAVVAALLVAVPTFRPVLRDPPLEVTTIELPPPPERPPAKPANRVEPRPAPPLDAPRPLVETPPTADAPLVPPLPPQPWVDLSAGDGSGTGTVDPAPPLPGQATGPVPAPLIVGPALDPRYAHALQPSYPPAERRIGAEGKVTVRVLVGADGRVRRVERVAATSDAFYRATEAQALRRWRFRPGTRDGVAQEAWRTMTVTFVMAG